MHKEVRCYGNRGFVRNVHYNTRGNVISSQAKLLSLEFRSEFKFAVIYERI